MRHIVNICDNKEPTDYSELAETAVEVREISKKLGQARIQSVVETVLIVTKPGDSKLIALTKELVMSLITTPRFGKSHGVIVYVDISLKSSKKFDYKGLINGSSIIGSHLKFWTPELCAASPEIFNLVLTLGGDGTVLYTSWLFQKVVPPVLAFHLGSLGFLTNFDFKDYKKHLTNSMEKGIRVNLRMRFTCTVYRRVQNPEHQIKAKRCTETGEIMMQHIINGKSNWADVENHNHSEHHQCSMDKDLPCLITHPSESFEVLNDLVVDRGAGPYMSLLELFGDNQHLTTVQADGLVVSTPTGSTAYSVSAGGSLVHPGIPALLITPICPHTLSFRPMLLPDSLELRICVPYNSRSTAWASFDGRGRIELKQGDHIKVTPSKFPFPTVCLESQSNDWFNSISRCLRWNERERQKGFVVFEEGSDINEDVNEEEKEELDEEGKLGKYKVDENSEQGELQELIGGNDCSDSATSDVEEWQVVSRLKNKKKHQK
ncbi:10450_t:CDS:2 [Entrophospora sp. SA101]|nr:10450_t:CDS:2 [Entrophospora sp. SA101]